MYMSLCSWDQGNEGIIFVLGVSATIIVQLHAFMCTMCIGMVTIQVAEQAKLWSPGISLKACSVCVLSHSTCVH